jgi:uncharacterized membrane protein
MHLKTLYKTVLINKKGKYACLISIILAFLGFLDATYLSILHFKHIIPPCTLAHSCDIVLTSKYATIGSIPIALIGSVFYLTLLLLLFLFLDIKYRIFILLLRLFVFLALCISIFLVIIQAAILHAFCQYCLASEGINMLLFISIIVIDKN